MRQAAIRRALPRTLATYNAVLGLRPLAVLRELLRQPLSVWSLYIYVFFEYVRPQTIYPGIDVLPWAQIALVVAVLSALNSELKKRRWMILDTGIAMYSLVVLASLLTAFDPGTGWDGLDVYFSWVLVYFALSCTVNTSVRMILLLVGWLLWNLKMSLHGFTSWASIGFAFRDWGVTGAPGWFENSGEFGIEMCVVFPISLYFALGVRRQVSRAVFLLLLVLPFTAVTGAIASSSRGALVGMAAIAVWMLARSRYKVRGLLVLAAAAGLVFAFVPPEQRARLSAAGDDGTSMSRLVYWKRGIEFANSRPLLGVGYRNWIPVYRYVWGGRLEQGERIQLPHNFAIEALSELGYTGLLALLFLLIGSFVVNARTRRLARRLGRDGELAENLGWGFDGGLIGFIVSGSFVTVLYYPYLWVNLAMTAALHLSVRRTLAAVAVASRDGPATTFASQHGSQPRERSRPAESAL